MTTLIITVIIAFVVVVFSVALLGISKLLTGKSRLRSNMCGKIPEGKEGEDYTCSICGKGPGNKNKCEDE